MKRTEPYKSPDKLHKVELFLAGGIKFGPEYFTVSIDGQRIQNRLFGRPYKWDINSKYLALQEWLTIDYQKGPITALFIVDLKQRRWARLEIVEKKFIEPVGFEEDKIIYKKGSSEISQSMEYRKDLIEVENWENYLYNLIEDNGA